MALDTGLLTRVVNPIKFGINDHITPYITVQARRKLCHWQSHPKAERWSGLLKKKVIEIKLVRDRVIFGRTKWEPSGSSGMVLAETT